MKKLVFLFLSLLAVGSLFQACDNSKTYAEMLEDEKNAVEKFISDNGINVISLEDFERNDTVTDLSRNEYVFFPSDGIYMQIVERGDKDANDENMYKFENNNEICTRYAETNIATGELAAFNIPMDDYMDASQLYANPAVFRYVKTETYAAGTFIQMDYVWATYYQSTVVPQGWLLALPYVRDNAHVRLIIPSKMGHQSAQQYVTPYFYDITEFRKTRS